MWVFSIDSIQMILALGKEGNMYITLLLWSSYMMNPQICLPARWDYMLQIYILFHSSCMVCVGCREETALRLQWEQSPDFCPCLGVVSICKLLEEEKTFQEQKDQEQGSQ